MVGLCQGRVGKKEEEEKGRSPLGVLQGKAHYSMT